MVEAEWVAEWAEWAEWGRAEWGRTHFRPLLHTPKSIIVHIADPGKGFSFDALLHAAISHPQDSPIHHVEVRAEAGIRPGGFASG